MRDRRRAIHGGLHIITKQESAIENGLEYQPPGGVVVSVLAKDALGSGPHTLEFLQFRTIHDTSRQRGYVLTRAMNTVAHARRAVASNHVGTLAKNSQRGCSRHVRHHIVTTIDILSNVRNTDLDELVVQIGKRAAARGSSIAANIARAGSRRAGDRPAPAGGVEREAVVATWSLDDALGDRVVGRAGDAAA